MEWELRIILGIIGAIIIGFVAFDAFKRNRETKRKSFDFTGVTDDDYRDGEGFDRDGIGQVRVIKLDANDRQSDNYEPSNDRPSNNGYQHETSDLCDESIIASREERLLVEESADALDDENEDYLAEPELIFSLTLVNKEQPFSGAELLQLLIEKGCRFGEMDIFHRYKSAQNTKQKYFSIANAFKPGIFDLDTMSSQTFAGISFFMGVPGAYEPEIAYQTMVQTARELKQALGGKLMDSSRSVFTEQTFQHELEQIKEYKRKKLTKAHT
jgi:cell division protein ZipA